VGRPGFAVARNTHAGDDVAAIGRPCVIARIAERLARNVAVERTAEQAGFGDGSRTLPRQGGDEQAAAAAVVPGIPVAHEQLVVDTTAGLVRSTCVELLLGAGEVGGAVGEGIGAEGHAALVRGQPVAAYIQRKARKLARLASGGGHRVELLRDRKSTRLNSSHVKISYAVFCLKEKKYR